MRLKAFVASYVLFLLILFSTVTIISAYMTNSQTEILREMSIREYQSISASLARDIAVLYGGMAGRGAIDFSEAVESLVRGYARYYSRYNISIFLTDFSFSDEIDFRRVHETEIIFIQREQEHFIHITGALPQPFQFFRLDYYFNITDNISNMQAIQQALMFF